MSNGFWGNMWISCFFIATFHQIVVYSLCLGRSWILIHLMLKLIGKENAKWMREHHETLSECLQEDNVHYRILIMCPGHLPQKWKREIESNVPYAHAEILNSLEDVLKLRDLPKKAQRKEFFIIGKDFCKLSYEEKPAPKRYGRKMSVKKICIQCGEEKMTPGNECDCG